MNDARMFVLNRQPDQTVALESFAIINALIEEAYNRMVIVTVRLFKITCLALPPRSASKPYTVDQFMQAYFPLIFSSPRSLQFALALVVLIIVVAAIRKSGFGRLPQLLVLFGAVSLATAAGQPIWMRHTRGSIAVMVDLSPSTRGAIFRNRVPLDLRIHQLLGDQSYRAVEFADHNEPLPPGDLLADLPTDKTIFQPPPDADAILLFSDGQFELPHDAPPTYPVIDPVLNHPADSAVTELKSDGSRIVATVKNEDPTRALHWTGAIADKNQPQIARPTDANQVIASLPPGDLWPENDSLAIDPPPSENSQNWWVGSSAPSGWLNFSASTIPTDSSDFLQASVIVLNNISADALSSAQQQDLLQYVRDLGGALVIVGGDHAFATGSYDGSLLENLSPLSSSPPLATQQWLLLIDGSGSMAGDPWQTEIAAIARLTPQLPPHDPVTVGSFARTLSLWPGTNVPPGIFPTGPTNLAAALQQIIKTSDGSSPTQLLLLTDAETDFPNPADLAAGLNAKKIHLHLLAIGQGSALPALKIIASSTQGSVLEQLDPRQWINSAKQLLHSALPDHFQHGMLPVTPAPPLWISQWNQTWLKPSATMTQQSGATPLAARWQMGLGQVIALAYPAEPNIVMSFAKQIASPPRDPRFKVTWEAGASLRVTVDAIDGDRYLNGEPLTVEMDRVTTQLPQTAPGQYQIALPAPRIPQIVTVRNSSRVLERFAVAGRYPPEFDAIGNNLENLKTLAAITGGSVIQPGPVHPIDFQWPVRQAPLSSEFAFVGFAAISAGMVWNKLFPK